MVFRLTLVHKLPKPFVGVLVIAPPEIAVAGLVERSPKHCYSLITEGGEFLRYGVDILNDSNTFFAYLAVLLKLFDILKAEFCDVYDDGNKDAQVNIMLFLQSISRNKPIAMSECGSFPDIQSIADEKAMWAFIGQWGGNYLMTDDGKLAEENNTAAELIKTYNNNLTLTRDKLPDFTHLASSIKDTEEKSAESKKNDSSKADSKTKKENTSKAE